MVRLFSVITGVLWKGLISKFQPFKGTVSIGEYTYGIPTVLSFRRDDRVKIGKFCSIADDVVIIVSGEHRYDRVATFPLRSRFVENVEADTFSRGPVIIGNDVWIGSRAIILSGVKIDDGAVIGAGAVVTNDVPPYAIVAGVPAKVLRFRFTREQITKLLEIAWWNWGLEKIIRNMNYFYGDLEIFIEKFSKDGTSMEE